MSKVSRLAAAKLTRAKSPDGLIWPLEREKEINEALLAAFTSPSGQTALEYLKQYTGMALGPHATDAELRHAAGQRHLISIIDARMALGSAERKKPNEPVQR